MIPGHNLAGRRILVVEDEYYIASDIRRALTKCGAAIVGPFGNLDEGLAYAARDPLDAALLDVNLGSASSYPIAEELSRRGVPYLFLTGYDQWSLPLEFRSLPRIGKPFTFSVLLDALERLLLETAE